MDDTGFPKFQYSVFTEDGHKGQYVVRTNDKDEYIMLVEFVNSMVAPNPTQPTTMAPLMVPETKYCPACGSEMIFRSGTNKEGKVYKGYFCPKDSTHKPVWTH